MKYKLVVVLITLLLASGIHVWAKSDDGTGYDRDNSALTGPRLTPSNSGTLLIEQDILINDLIPYVLGFDIYKDNTNFFISISLNNYVLVIDCLCFPFQLHWRLQQPRYSLLAPRFRFRVLPYIRNRCSHSSCQG